MWLPELPVMKTHFIHETHPLSVTQFITPKMLILAHSIRGFNPWSLRSITLGWWRHCTSPWKQVAEETHLPHRGCRITKGRKMLGSGDPLQEHTPDDLTLPLGPASCMFYHFPTVPRAEEHMTPWETFQNQAIIQSIQTSAVNRF